MMRKPPTSVLRSQLRRPAPKAALAPDEIDPDVLEWAEKSGIENLKMRIATADTIAKEAATTLTVLIAGLGGALAYGIKVVSPSPDAIAYGAAFLCAYLIVLAVLLIRYCLLLSPIPALYNEPKNLTRPGLPLKTLRAMELKNIQARIERAVARNNRIGQQLNAVRLAAVLSPIVFALGSGIGMQLSPPDGAGAPRVDLQCTYAAASTPLALNCQTKPP